MSWIRPQTESSELKIITYSSSNINHGNQLIGLPSQPATIDAKNFTRNITAGLTCQKHDRALEVLRLPPSTSGNSRHDAGVAVTVIDQSNVHVGVDVSGGHRVDIDALGRPFVGQGLGQLGDATLGSSVGWDCEAALEGEQ